MSHKHLWGQYRRFRVKGKCGCIVTIYFKAKNISLVKEAVKWWKQQSCQEHSHVGQITQG